MSAICACGIAPAWAAAQDVNEQIRQLREEVRILRLEVLQQKAAFEGWKVQNLTGWLEQIRQQRQHAAGEAQSVKQELAELEIATGNPSAEPTPELNVLKDKIVTDRLPKIERWLQSVMQRESELNSQLHAENARLAATEQQIRQIKQGAPN